MKFSDRIKQGAQDKQQAGGQRRRKTYDELRKEIHDKVVDRLDVATVQSLTKEQLRVQLREAVGQVVARDQMPLNEVEQENVVTSMLDEIKGLGPLEAILADPGVSDILINNYNHIYVEKGGKLTLSPVHFRDNKHLLNTLNRIVSAVGRRVDESSPMVDARLKDGSRVNAIIPPLALDGPSVSIRRFGDSPPTIPDLIKFGALTEQMAQYLKSTVVATFNCLVSGGTGSGKTTMLNALSSYIPEDNRVITMEDSAELQLKQEHVVRLETRPPNIEGKGAITIADLVKNSLRMRPDRIVIGEVRSVEVIDMLQAMNTGHDGSMATIHANTADDAMSRLMTMIAMAGTKLGEEAMVQIIGRALHLVVQLARLSDGSRRCISITEIVGFDETSVRTRDVFVFQQTGFTPERKIIGRYVNQYQSSYGERFRKHGVDPGIPCAS